MANGGKSKLMKSESYLSVLYRYCMPYVFSGFGNTVAPYNNYETGRGTLAQVEVQGPWVTTNKQKIPRGQSKIVDKLSAKFSDPLVVYHD